MNGRSYFALQPLSELAIWGWRLERRTEFLWRDQFDRVLLPPLFAACQAALNAGRANEGMAIAEERILPDEERCIQEIIDEIAAFMKENWLPGSVQRFGNTKTYGVVRGEFRVREDLPEHLRRGIFAEARTFPAWVRFAGPGPYAPPDLYDYGQCSVGIKLMDVPGPKLLDDERFTQDLIMVTPASFVTPNVQENAKLQRYVRARTNLFYFVNPSDTHVLAGLMQALFSRMQTSPLAPYYYSNVPFLLGDGQAVQYSLRPRSPAGTRIPVRASDNYLREAMARTLAQGPWSFDFMVQTQTDAYRMPIEDATVKWPEKLSPYVPVAELRLPRQRFESPAQLAFADNLSYNPWHSLPEHRPLGNQNRARRRMYQELSRLRQSMNGVPHIEPTGAERFGNSGGARRRARARAAQVQAGDTTSKEPLR
jgi:hypothetical protein